jgi:hypothetical protein
MLKTAGRNIERLEAFYVVRQQEKQQMYALKNVSAVLVPHIPAMLSYKGKARIR